MSSNLINENNNSANNSTNNNNNNLDDNSVILDSHFFSKNNLSNFSKENPTILILIYFTAKWCGPCKEISPFFTKTKQEYKEKKKDVIFKKIDVDDDNYSDLCDELSVTAMPTFLFLRNCNILNKIVGNDKEGIIELLNIHS